MLLIRFGVNLRYFRIRVRVWTYSALVPFSLDFEIQTFGIDGKIWNFLLFILFFTMYVHTLFPLLLFWYVFSCLTIEKMVDEQRRYKHGIVTQYVPVCTKIVKLSWFTVGELPRTTKGSSSRGDISFLMMYHVSYVIHLFLRWQIVES